MNIKLLDGSTVTFDMSGIPNGANRIFEEHHMRIPGLFWPKTPGDEIIFVRPDVAHMEHDDYSKISKKYLQFRRVPKMYDDEAMWYGHDPSPNDSKKLSVQALKSRIESLAKFILLNWPKEDKVKMSISFKLNYYCNTIEQLSVGIFTSS